MSSKPSGTSHSDDSIESVIAKHGKSLAKETDPASQQLQERLDKLELAIEEIGQKSELITSFNEYLKDLREDLRAVRRTRFWLLIIALSFVTGANAIVTILLFNSGWFWLQDTYFKSVAFVGVLTASVVLLSIMIKGAFHSLADRKNDDMVPPHIKEILEGLKLIK